jgi:hypothetical protein
MLLLISMRRFLTIHLAYLSALFLVFLGFHASATIYFVNVGNATPELPFTNWNTAATNIQNAINASANGDQIIVTDGVYNAGLAGGSDGVPDRVAAILPVTIQSVNGPASTTISGGNIFRCVYLTNGAELNGFTLTAGVQNGGGVYCVSTNALVENCVIACSPNSWQVYSGTLSNCTIVCPNQGHATGGASGSTLLNCLVLSNFTGVESGILNNCTISNNYEGGLYDCAATGCKILNNYNTSEGAGAYGCELTNCLLAGNVSLNYGGGAYMSTLVNCTIVNNSAQGSEGGVYACSLFNCIAYNNTNGNFSGAAHYSCTFPLATGTGNFTNAPLFVNLTNDFHLQSTSPCINSGNNVYTKNATDLDGNPRIQLQVL